MVSRFRRDEAHDLSSRALFLAVLGLGITSTGVAHAQTVRQIINGPPQSNILADAVGRTGNPAGSGNVDKQVQLSLGPPQQTGSIAISNITWRASGTSFTLNYNAPTNTLHSTPPERSPLHYQ